MLLQFTFPGGEGGRVRFKNKFVRTKGFLEEQVGAWLGDSPPMRRDSLLACARACVCACVRVFVRACVRASVCAYMRVCVRVYAHASMRVHGCAHVTACTFVRIASANVRLVRECGNVA
jgi:hypothetical protein